jgi:hypothetical protein
MINAPRVRLGLSRIQVSGFTHRQAGQAGNSAAAVPGHGYRKISDGVGLVDDHEHTTVLLQPGEQLAQPRLILRQGLVEDSFAGCVQCRGVVL